MQCPTIPNTVEQQELAELEAMARIGARMLRDGEKHELFAEAGINVTDSLVTAGQRARQQAVFLAIRNSRTTTLTSLLRSLLGTPTAQPVSSGVTASTTPTLPALV